MQLTFMWKDSASTNGQCPALYRTDSGDYVVQGKAIDQAARAQLRDLGFDEDAVLVPANVLDRLRGQ